MFLFLSQVAYIHANFQFVYNSMRHLTDIKTKIEHAVDSWYEFDTSRAPDSIGDNVIRAQTLLNKMTFVYGVRPVSSPFVAN